MSSTFGTRRGYRAVAVAVAIVLTGAQAAAQAEDAPGAAPPSREARAHFERGVTFYDEADYAAALVEFKRAYALAPTWQVLFNIGQAYFQVREYAEALSTLRQFIDEGRDRIPADRRTLVNAELGDLANRVGHVAIESNLDGAAVTIDKTAVGTTPMTEAVQVSVGVRRVIAIHPGRQPVEKDVPVAAGETVEVHLDFAEPTAASVQTPDDATASPTPGAQTAPPIPARSEAPAIIAFGIAAAGATAGAMFGTLALRDKSRLNDECSGKACAIGSQSDIDAVSRDATISTIGFGVMALGAGVGLGLWFAAHSSPDRAQDARLVNRPRPALSIRIVPGFVAGSF